MAKQNMLTDHYDIPERVSSVEVQVKNLAQSLEQTNRAVENLADNVEKGFEKIGSSLTEKNKTNWPVLFGAFSVVVVLLGWFISARIEPLNTSLAYEVKIKQLQFDYQQKELDYLSKKVDNIEKAK